MREARPGDLLTYLQDSETRFATCPLLLDVREPWEFDICHLDGAKLVPMQQVPGAAEALDKDAEIVVICHHGIRSRQVAHYLESLGFSNLTNLDGGVQAWAKDVDSNMATY